MRPNKFEPCSECGVSTHDSCEICHESVCSYCADDHRKIHEEKEDDE